MVTRESDSISSTVEASRAGHGAMAMARLAADGSPVDPPSGVTDRRRDQPCEAVAKTPRRSNKTWFYFVIDVRTSGQLSHLTSIYFCGMHNNILCTLIIRSIRSTRLLYREIFILVTTALLILSEFSYRICYPFPSQIVHIPNLILIHTW